MLNANNYEIKGENLCKAPQKQMYTKERLLSIGCHRNCVSRVTSEKSTINSDMYCHQLNILNNTPKEKNRQIAEI